jgi:hypothetical protein
MSIGCPAAIVFSVVTAGVIAFQLALAAGAPWGDYAMGGADPGQFSAALRAAAVVQAAVLGLTVVVVLARAGIAFASWSRVSRWLVWVVVVLGVASLVMNLATPSAGERVVWAPVALILLACSLTVALSKPASPASETDRSAPHNRVL